MKEIFERDRVFYFFVYVTTIVVAGLFGIILKRDISNVWAILSEIVLALFVFWGLGLFFIDKVENNINEHMAIERQRMQKQTQSEWEAALQIAKKEDNRITDKTSEFVLTKAKASFIEGKQEKINIMVKTEREKFIAEHIIDTSNELFTVEEEKEET